MLGDVTVAVVMLAVLPSRGDSGLAGGDVGGVWKSASMLMSLTSPAAALVAVAVQVSGLDGARYPNLSSLHDTTINITINLYPDAK